MINNFLFSFYKIFVSFVIVLCLSVCSDLVLCKRMPLVLFIRVYRRIIFILTILVLVIFIWWTFIFLNWTHLIILIWIVVVVSNHVIIIFIVIWIWFLDGWLATVSPRTLLHFHLVLSRKGLLNIVNRCKILGHSIKIILLLLKGLVHNRLMTV